VTDKRRCGAESPALHGVVFICNRVRRHQGSHRCITELPDDVEAQQLLPVVYWYRADDDPEPPRRRAPNR